MKMERYIGANALLKKIFPIGMIDDGNYVINAKAIKVAVDNTPTADVVEVVHGSWGFDGIGWTCSECGEYALSNKAKMQVHSVFCPHCGARMDEESKKK